jgi:predicted unusual protein kinase regulating ubiquinone biosynthesis (AarF/ABC1/UbiB family)
VAVKIRRPEIASVVEADLVNLRTALAAIERIEGDSGLTPLLDEMAKAVPLELDFAREAENSRRIARAFEGDPRVRIPGVIDALSTSRVLVTEFASGIKVTDLRRMRRLGIDPHDVAAVLVDAYAAQILRHGFFHADPHPGNLLVVPTETGFSLAFVDFGLAQEVPEGFRERVGTLASALLRGVPDAVAAALRELGLTASDETLSQVGALLVDAARAGSEPDAGEVRRRVARELARRVREDPEARLTPYLWGMARVLGLVSGVAASLGARIDLVSGVLPHLAPTRKA